MEALDVGGWGKGIQAESQLPNLYPRGTTTIYASRSDAPEKPAELMGLCAVYFTTTMGDCSSPRSVGKCKSWTQCDCPVNIVNKAELDQDWLARLPCKDYIISVCFRTSEIWCELIGGVRTCMVQSKLIRRDVLQRFIRRGDSPSIAVGKSQWASI